MGGFDVVISSFAGTAVALGFGIWLFKRWMERVEKHMERVENLECRVVKIEAVCAMQHGK